MTGQARTWKHVAWRVRQASSLRYAERHRSGWRRGDGSTTTTEIATLS